MTFMITMAIIVWLDQRLPSVLYDLIIIVIGILVNVLLIGCGIETEINLVQHNQANIGHYCYYTYRWFRHGMHVCIAIRIDRKFYTNYLLSKKELRYLLAGISQHRCCIWLFRTLSFQNRPDPGLSSFLPGWFYVCIVIYASFIFIC